MDVRPIRTEADYEAALIDLERLMEVELGTPEYDKLEVLSVLVEAYETEHYPVPLPDPIEAIEFHMERLGLTRKDLEACLGSRARVSEILNRRRPLNLRMIRNLEDKLGIPAAILVQEYALAQGDRLGVPEKAASPAGGKVKLPVLQHSPVSTYTSSGTEDNSTEPIPAPAWMIPENYKKLVRNTAV